MPLDIEIENLRKEYTARTLEVEEAQMDPFQQFEEWFAEAVRAQLPEPNAMTLATVAPNGQPSARIVLLKGFDREGFVFYTNYRSRKGEEMRENPRVALVFLWLELQRQVRIEGAVERIDPEESTRYFQSRPRGSQIGAWASPQSAVIDRREDLEQRYAALESQYEEAEVLPRPAHWGGYLVRPHRLEFWQGRASRLHDRIQYRLEEGRWVIERLAP
jgi:pyridoxamine 5'-phosphate oxidase